MVCSIAPIVHSSGLTGEISRNIWEFPKIGDPNIVP